LDFGSNDPFLVVGRYHYAYGWQDFFAVGWALLAKQSETEKKGITQVDVNDERDAYPKNDQHANIPIIKLSNGPMDELI
jgi:hypothetical protein